jgi:transposase
MAAVQPIYKIIQQVLVEGYLSQQDRQTEDQRKLVKQIDRDKHLLADLLESMAQIEDFPEELLAELQSAAGNKLNTLQLAQLYRKINRVLLTIARKRFSRE